MNLEGFFIYLKKFHTKEPQSSYALFCTLFFIRRIDRCVLRAVRSDLPVNYL